MRIHLNSLLPARVDAPAPLPPVGRVPGPYRGAPLVSVPSDAGRLLFRADDGVMLPFVRSRGTWDPDVGRVLLDLLRPGMTFVDIGANVGYFSRLAAVHRSPAAIHAFEPHPELVDVLRLNLWDVAPQAVVWPCALGDSRGTVTLESSDHNIGDTRAFAPDERPATMVAAVARLDDVLDGPVDVVKIDVQGFELEVFIGMERTIRRNPQIAIALEYWPGGLRERGEDPRDVLDAYTRSGLAVHLIRDGVPLASDAAEILAYCDSAGPGGQANLLLRRS